MAQGALAPRLRAIPAPLPPYPSLLFIGRCPPTGVPEGVFSVLVESTQGFEPLTDCPSVEVGHVGVALLGFGRFRGWPRFRP